MKPIFNKLLEQSFQNPSDLMLEKFLAFKKSIMAFETNVASVKKALDGLLENDLDMADLVRVNLTVFIFSSERFVRVSLFHCSRRPIEYSIFNAATCDLFSREVLLHGWDTNTHTFILNSKTSLALEIKYVGHFPSCVIKYKVCCLPCFCKGYKKIPKQKINILIFLKYLSQDREMNDHEEVELWLEGYRSDFQEVQLELRSMRAQIDDTRWKCSF